MSAELRKAELKLDRATRQIEILKSFVEILVKTSSIDSMSNADRTKFIEKFQAYGEFCGIGEQFAYELTDFINSSKK